jgi:hypothetical protein
MDIHQTEIKVRGKKVTAPSVCIDGLTVVTVGRLLRKAAIFDEEWLEGRLIDSPERFIAQLKQSPLRADYFTFAQRIPDVKPLYAYPREWENFAVIPITKYQDWWTSVSTDMRKDVKKASARGVVTKVVPFDDTLVQGIIAIHHDTPIRQGRAFAHFHKDFETVKREYSTYPGRSEFIAAFWREELIGLIKIVYVADLACMMQILSKTRHYDKRPTNALIAKAVEVCVEKGKSYLTYGQLFYGNKKRSSLVSFKRRNGFQPVFFPRYFIPLTVRGRIAIALKFHRGLLGLLPAGVITLLVRLRILVEKALRRGGASDQQMNVEDQD